jgi:hypothetical protein
MMLFVVRLQAEYLCGVPRRVLPRARAYDNANVVLAVAFHARPAPGAHAMREVFVKHILNLHLQRLCGLAGVRHRSLGSGSLGALALPHGIAREPVDGGEDQLRGDAPSLDLLHDPVLVAVGVDDGVVEVVKRDNLRLHHRVLDAGEVVQVVHHGRALGARLADRQQRRRGRAAGGERRAGQRAAGRAGRATRGGVARRSR